MKKILGILFVIFSSLIFAEDISLKPDNNYQYIKDIKKDIYGNVDGRSVGELQTERKKLEDMKSIAEMQWIESSANGRVQESIDSQKKIADYTGQINRLQKVIDEKSSGLVKATEIANIVKFLTTVFTQNEKYIKLVAFLLLRLLGVLELLSIIIDKPTDIPIAPITKLIKKVAIVYFFIENWFFFNKAMVVQIKQWSAFIASKGTGYYPQNINVEEIFSYFAEPFFFSISLLGIKDLLLSPVNFVFLLLYIVGFVIIAFICLEYIMALLDFYFVMLISILVLPFNILQQTANIGIRIIGIMIYQFLKLFIFYYFIQLGYNMVESLGGINFMDLSSSTMTNLNILCGYILSLFIVKVFLTKASTFANMLVGGGSALSGRDATGILVGAVAGAISSITFLYKSGKMIAGASSGNLASAAASAGEMAKNGARRIAGAAKNLTKRK